MSELFIEVRCEELPAGMVRPALQGLQEGVLGLLKGIEHGAVRTWATPRRLAVAVSDVAQGKPLEEKLVTGPPADRAFKDGEPTQAGIGFARGRGADPKDLRIVDGPKGPVVALVVKEGGERTVDIVREGLGAVVLGLPFKKSMAWGTGGLEWGRPLHGVAALYDGQTIPAVVGPLVASNVTLGHRLSELGALHFHDSASWLQGLRDRRVEPDLAVRAEQIDLLLQQAANKLEADRIDEVELLEEVLHLVECPTLVIGRFDEALLGLPPRLLVQSMKDHQRYFPVHRKGVLTNTFVVISNNPWGDHDLVAEGNARVLRARFYDARFFLAEDKRKTLTQHGEHLQRMQWIRGLGTMAEKQVRVAVLAEQLASLTGADPAVAHEAGSLCKSDLTSQMVGEFAKLQGHMGKLYALHEGRSEAVATAIEEHYQPAGAKDAPPATAAGAAVALADRLDTLAGCFSIGMVPKGGGDPQGLRRAASGVLTILADRGLRADLGQLFAMALGAFDGGSVEDLVAFALTRFKAAAVSDGASADQVDAVIAVTEPDPIVLAAKLAALRQLAASDDFEDLLQTVKRALNITRGAKEAPPARASLAGPEAALAAAIDGVAGEVAEAAANLEFDAALKGALKLKQPVADFFDAVLVDDPDPAIKARRVGLLLEAAGIFLTLADFTRITTR